MRTNGDNSIQLLDSEELGAWRGMLRVHAELTRALDAELHEAHSLPLSSYEVLLFLAGEPEGRMRMSELADSVLLSRSGLTRLVDRLERAGLLERVQCSEDARGYFAQITPAGREAFNEARRTHLEGVGVAAAARSGEVRGRHIGKALVAVPDQRRHAPESAAQQLAGHLDASRRTAPSGAGRQLLPSADCRPPGPGPRRPSHAEAPNPSVSRGTGAAHRPAAPAAPSAPGPRATGLSDSHGRSAVPSSTSSCRCSPQPSSPLSGGGTSNWSRVRSRRDPRRGRWRRR